MAQNRERCVDMEFASGIELWIVQRIAESSTRRSLPFGLRHTGQLTSMRPSTTDSRRFVSDCVTRTECGQNDAGRERQRDEQSAAVHDPSCWLRRGTLSSS
jgi:hypothetical protein